MREPTTRKAQFHYELAVIFGLIFSFVSMDLQAQGNLKPEPDVLVFANGEKLIGQFESVTGKSAKFKSDTLGEVTVDLSKIQELHTSQEFAVVRKDLKLSRGEVDGQIPRGTISIVDQKVEIGPSRGQPSQTIAVGDVGNIIDEAGFEQALHHPGFFEKWRGGVTLGASLVEATQNSLSVNTSASFIRAIPSVNWLAPRNRTSVDFNDSYGIVKQPGDPTLKTSIYHADAERDEYFTSQVYALAAVAFDHNFSQGLDLQQMYGGGIGWTVIQTPKQTLDLKGSIDYEKQAFEPPAVNQNLVNSVFSEDYNLKFVHGILIRQQLSAVPGWSNTRDYSASASVGIIFPVYKRLGFNMNIIDSLLNDPPPGFKKNSFQFTSGLSYTLP